MNAFRKPVGLLALLVGLALAQHSASALAPDAKTDAADAINTAKSKYAAALEATNAMPPVIDVVNTCMGDVETARDLCSLPYQAQMSYNNWKGQADQKQSGGNQKIIEAGGHLSTGISKLNSAEECFAANNFTGAYDEAVSASQAFCSCVAACADAYELYSQCVSDLSVCASILNPYLPGWWTWGDYEF